MPIDLFITKLFDPQSRFFYLAWVLTAMVSIVLHELAHGLAAVRLGDPTPMRQNRITLNPFVHLGGVSLIVLVMMGMAWGGMPVDPTRLRGRHAEAMVSAAGPAMNLLLAVAGLTTLGLLLRFDLLHEQVNWQVNLQELLWVFGLANAVLGVFNLMPVPPLDGSRILGCYHRPFARFAGDPAQFGAHMLMFAAAFAVSGVLWEPLAGLASRYTAALATIGAS